MPLRPVNGRPRVGLAVVARGQTHLLAIPNDLREAAANLLTNPALDPFGKIPEFKYCAVRVAALQSA